MSRRGWIGLGLGVLVVAVLASRALGSRPDKESGSPFAPCPETPNCAHVAVPLDAEPGAALKAARLALAEVDAEVADTTADGALRAAAPIGPFVDDVEVAAVPRDGGSTLWVTSRSRTGRSDLGVNRRRVWHLVEAVRERVDG